MKLQHINTEQLHAQCSYLFYCLSYSLPSSLLTMCSIEGLFFRSISTHSNPISMHTFSCWRELASSEEYLDTMCSIVQFWRTYKIGIRYINWCYNFFSSLKSSSCVILRLTFSTKFLADMSSLLRGFLSPVVISMISRPKLYMSNWVEISPLYRYSGAMYPLEGVSIKKS